MSIEIPDWLKYEIMERWQKFREAVNKNPKAVWGITLASGFVLFLVLISILSGEPRPTTRPVKKVWFYDLNTGELFAASDDKAGPIDAPSGPLPGGGPAGVRAYVYSYRPEPDRNDLHIGYLLKPDPNAMASDSNTNRGYYQLEEKLIRTVADANWVSAQSSRGRRIIRQATRRNEAGQIPRYVPPK